MTTTEETNSVKNGNEPSMFVQRPSSGRCQDISHVLTRIFRDVYTNDAVHQDTVKNLTTSKSGKSGYHDSYVENLQQIQQQWEEKMRIAQQIEQHIIDAHNQARENEIVEEQSSVDSISNYNDLGLPSVASQLSLHLDADTLRGHNLIVPQDFISEEKQNAESESGERTPQYARPTTSSIQRYRKIPQEDNYHLEKSANEIENKNSNNVNILTIDHIKNDALQEERSKPIKKKVKGDSLDEKQMWRNGMKSSQRMIEKKDLEKLQKKSDYLKNPRFLPLKQPCNDKSLIKEEQTDIINKDLQRCDPRKIFKPYPDPVTFVEYEAGGFYEITFSLKNLTSSSRQVRVLPPLTPFFSIGLGKFPTTDGLIAPGMSCQYSIKFAPDSLADYDDVLKVETTFAEPLFVPLQARRPPPNLSLSTTFNCGHCLVNGTKTVQFDCINKGGEGRFCVLPKSQWPTTKWEFTMDDPGYVNLGPFVLRPAMFHLKTNETINIEVIFSPSAVKICKEEIIMICDNCNIKNFYIEGVGETAAVEFISVENGLSDYKLCEMKDSSAELLLRFENQYPGTTKKKKLIIKNTTAVDIEYHWYIDRPIFNYALVDGKKFEKNSFDNNANLAFEIVPSKGKLTPSALSSFEIKFKPKKMLDYHNVARLILKNVPSLNENEKECSDVVSTEIELKGYTKLFDVELDPKAIFLDGNPLINTPYENKVMIHNKNDTEVTFNWPQFDDDNCSIGIFPNEALIGANESFECFVTITGKAPGRIRHICVCNIGNVSSPVFCQIEAEFVGPTVLFAETILNFGLVRHLQNQMREVELKNHSNIPALWDFKEDLTNFHRAVSLSPTSGLIEPCSSQTITVFLNADVPCMLENILEFDIQNGENCFIEARAVIQRPEVCILSSKLEIEECFVNVPIKKTIYLHNMTLFSVGYNWSELIGSDKQYTSIIFQPNHGILKPREKLEIEIIFNFTKQVEICDLFAACEVEGMEDPLFLSINANVCGLKIEYSTPDVTGDQLSFDEANKEAKLEFGYDVAMGLNPKSVLLIKNHSAIVAPFSIHIEYFKSARMPTPPPNNKLKNSDNKSRSGRLLLGKTPNIADHSSKTPEKAFKDHCNAILADGKGVAFIASPAEGQLGAFEQVLIEITAYCNMWGEYTDNLICKVGDLEPVRIPIHLETTGCPLTFQISKEPSPILRFGSHISGGKICSKSLKINNTGPCDIRLDWQSYVMDPNDDQLLDLFMMIGDPFPRLNENNEEIEDMERITEPLIQVKLNPHQGNRTDIPFQMKPTQMIVPAKSHSHAIANFIPIVNQKNKVELQGYALGFMCLSKQDAICNHTLRCDGIDVRPFHLNFTADVKPAKLFIEPESEDGFNFTMAASDLLVGNESSYRVGQEAVCSHRFVISNLSGTSLQFSMSADEPFQIMTDEASTANKKEAQFNLKQDNNFEVKIGLNLTPCLLISNLKNTRKENSHIENVEINEEYKDISNINLKRELRFQFSNKTSQFYELNGTIQLPILELSHQYLDFETCLVGQTRELYVNLKNSGKSSCHWTAAIDKDNPEASKSAFFLSPQNGLLQADIKYTTKNMEAIKVTFTARHNVEYECRVIFRDILGEKCLILMLHGRGSYDQISEKLVNILT